MPRTAQESQELAAQLPDEHVKIVDASKLSPAEREALLRSEIDDLQQQLAQQTRARSQAEQKLIDQAVAQVGQQEQREVPTQKFAKVKRLDVDFEGDDRMGYRTAGYKDDGRPILKPVFKEVMLPLYLYAIDLPPSGGESLSINGAKLYHGTVVELDEDLLRSVKEIVYRCWDHDRTINGSNENAYR
jgi:hypothetical protein